MRAEAELVGDLLGLKPQGQQAQHLHLSGSQGTGFASGQVAVRARWLGWGLPFPKHTIEGAGDPPGPRLIRLFVEQVHQQLLIGLGLIEVTVRPRRSCQASTDAGSAGSGRSG